MRIYFRLDLVTWSDHSWWHDLKKICDDSYENFHIGLKVAIKNI